MSHLPTPSRTVSRLPTPSSSSSQMNPPKSTLVKRRNVALDLEDSVAEAKRKKPVGCLNQKASSKSMLNLSATSSRNPNPGGIRLRRDAPTARPTAMLDRTNKANGSAPPAATAKGKRPAWDLKGRLEDMEMAHELTKKKLAAMENQNSFLKNDAEEIKSTSASITEDLEHFRSECERQKKRIDELTDENRQSKRLLDDERYEKSAMERRLRALEDELSCKQTELTGLRTTVAEVTSASAGLEARFKNCQEELSSAKAQISRLEVDCAMKQSLIDTLQDKQRTYETERRVLHNTILELKGNIRVFCRLRPLIGQELEKYNGEIKHISIMSDKNMEILRGPDPASGKVERFQFEFDHVFDHNCNQSQVFEEVSQLVQSAIDGYNVCIFAYGQTGSGKTFTMEGQQGELSGIIPRTIHKIFEETKILCEKGWKYHMKASFLEIYNEEIRDLLATEKGIKYDIKRLDSKSQEIYVANLKSEDVTDGETVFSLLNRAQKNRAVASTNCNERSSRSHSVFMLKISGVNSVTSEVCTGILNLVDLAGSERLKDSGSTGLRLEETKSINSSLSNLGKVILALANKEPHIPYRDSKLTHLLMNSLGGNSKTLMFVNLSPKEDSFYETLNSLRFAKRVNQCQIGTASKKVCGTVDFKQ